MIDDEIQIPAISIPSMVKVAVRMGMSVPKLLEMSELDDKILKITDALIPFSTMNRFLQSMLVKSELPTLGLYIGSDLGFDYLPDFERFITTSATARDAVRALALFERFSPFYHFELKEKPATGEAQIVVAISEQCPENLRSVYIEMIFTLIDRFGKLLLGEQYRLKKLILGFRLNGPLSEYKKIFQGPIEAGATYNAVVWDLSLLDLPLVSALPKENEKAERELKYLIQGALNKHGYKARVLEQMRSDIELTRGKVALVAKTMGVSVRAMQRKLKAENTSFSQIQLEARMEYATEKLAATNESMESISEQLGFANRRSFSRTFHHWYGTTPSIYRKMAQHGRVDA